MPSRRSGRKPKIIIGRHSGYCFGVKRAINLAEEALNDRKRKRPLYSLHPIIHNRQAVERLSLKGLKTVERTAQIKPRTSVIISSHGATRQTLTALSRRNIRIIDATCPRVINAQRLIGELNRQGYYVVIIGEKRHPEVKSLRSRAAKGCVVEAEADVSRIPLKEKRIGVVAQTTQSRRNVVRLFGAIAERGARELRIYDTLCTDTLCRQSEVRELAQRVDVMIVVGGRHSANTRRLAEICKEAVPTYHIERPGELRKSWFGRGSVAGIVSGASTPDWLVESVRDAILSFYRK